jgi:glutamyl-Q tRNA(Asp) synthetase
MRLRVATRALDALLAAGLLYRCFRTRRERLDESARAPHGRSSAVGIGPLSEDEETACLSAGTPFAWRLSLERARAHLRDRFETLGFVADGARVRAAPERLGDAIVARKEFSASYHLASVHDDALQGITHVIRGEDLRDAAHLHVLLQALLGLPTPEYRHHALILGPDGRRLAKRDRATTLAELRRAGVTPDEVRRRVGLPA